MGDFRRFYCPLCRMNTKHKKLEPETFIDRFCNELDYKDDWICLRCGKVQTHYHWEYKI